MILNHLKLAINHIDLFCLTHGVDDKTKREIAMVREFIEEHSPKRAIWDEDEVCYCPHCDEVVDEEDSYCKYCGQKIIWKVEEEY